MNYYHAQTTPEVALTALALDRAAPPGLPGLSMVSYGGRL